MSRNRIFAAALALTATAGYGVAVANEPPDGPGGYWIEYTYYDAAGTAIGGKWKDCTGHIATWGAAHGARTEVTRGPC